MPDKYRKLIITLASLIKSCTLAEASLVRGLPCLSSRSLSKRSATVSCSPEWHANKYLVWLPCLYVL